MNRIKKYILNIIYSMNEMLHRKIIISKENIFAKINYKEQEIKNVKSISIEKNIQDFKWVGAVNYNNIMYCINNRTDDVLKLDLENDKISYIKTNLGISKDFRWTGGCYHNGKIYGFPRTSNELLCIDPTTDKVSIIPLNLCYKTEHHYGGVYTNEGYIYQPPRNTNHILVINLNDFSTHKINIAPQFLKYAYLSGIQHLNGLIYFFPEKNERILVLNPKNEKFYFIGKRLKCLVFDAAIGKDENIYGFSGYEDGILKIEPKKNKAEMICTEIGIPGCYGSKLGINGEIYGIPGNGDYIWEFNVEKQKAKKIFKVTESGKAKCAGGVISKQGNIYTVPAYGNTIYKLEFSDTEELTDELLNSIYF